MIKKYMNQLYNEVEQIRRKLVSGKMRYFGDKDFGDANNYTVFLKNGCYFHINMGTNDIPKLRKKDIAYIVKLCNFTDSNKCLYYIDTDCGRYKYTKEQRYASCNYLTNRKEKYNIDWMNLIDTGDWD